MSKRIASIAAALAAPAAFAFQPLITDDTGTQGTGGNQLEFSWNEDSAETAGVKTRTQVIPLVYTRGITDALDVFVQANLTMLPDNVSPAKQNGSGNPSFGFKWRFYENEESKTSLGLKPEILLPVTKQAETEGFGTGRASFAVTGILTQETSFGAIHANIVSSRESYESAAIPGVRTMRYSIAPVLDVSEQWKLALDLGTESAESQGTTTRGNFVELGAIWSPSKDLDVALGLVRATDDASPRTTTNTLTAGVTWRFR